MQQKKSIYSNALTKNNKIKSNEPIAYVIGSSLENHKIEFNILKHL